MLQNRPVLAPVPFLRACVTPMRPPDETLTGFVVHSFDAIGAVVVPPLSVDFDICTCAEVEIVFVAAWSHEELVATLVSR